MSREEIGEKKHTSVAIQEEFPVYRNDQKFFAFAYISPETVINSPVHAFVFLGAFPTQEKANQYVKKIRDQVPIFDIYVGESYALTGLGNKLIAENVEYREEQLQELVTAYKESDEKAKKIETERRNEIREEALRKQAYKSTHETKTGARLKSKLDGKKVITDDDDELPNYGKAHRNLDEDEEVELKTKLAPPITKEEFEKREEKIKLETEQMKKNAKTIQEAESNIDYIDQQINMLKSKISKK